MLKRIILKMKGPVLVLVGIMGLMATLYSLREKRAKISFEILSEKNVIDIYEPLDNLHVYFQGKDIQHNNLNLRVYTIRIKNVGSDDIKQNSYDVDDIWGFRLSNGKITSLRFVNSNSSYLNSDKLSPKKVSSDTVGLNKVIFERGKHFTIEVLVLHERATPPEIVPLGKIIGIDNITPVKLWNRNPSFVEQLMHGSLVVHSVRAIIYIVAVILIIVILVLVISWLGDIVDKVAIKSRKIRLRGIARNGTFHSDDMRRKALDAYIYEGKSQLRRLNELLHNKEELTKLVKLHRRRSKIMDMYAIQSGNKEIAVATEHVLGHMPDPVAMSKEKLVVFDLIRMGVIVFENNAVVVNRTFDDAIVEILSYLDHS